MQRTASEPAVRRGFEFRHGPRASHEPPAMEWTVARRHLYRFNLLGAVERTFAEEKARQRRWKEAFEQTQREKWQIQTRSGAGPLWRREAPGEHGSSMELTLARKDVRPSTGPASGQNQTRSDSDSASIQKLGTMQDPRDLPNPRGARVTALTKAIADLQGSLQDAKADMHIRIASAAAAASPETVWDSLPPEAQTSEHRVQYYPRSLEKVKSLGTGKDPRWARPYDDSYKFREMMLMQKGMLSSKV
mmetsp:Transcript_3122/g.7032  ORF Transcript_3122/g.7032 Transcript_3122/m.7032 type:complete len:247 (-) Transcript_3122:159-899(-)